MAFEGPNPERLQTAMSLYSSKLSGLIMMVDGRVTEHGSGLKQGQLINQSHNFITASLVCTPMKVKLFVCMS